MVSGLTFPAVLDPAAPLDGYDWPLFGWAEDVRPLLARAVADGRAAVLATLYKRSGSAPRGPGAQMLFVGDAAAGFFSGGCVEADIARHAAEVAAQGGPRLLHYGTGSLWIDIRLRCGGAIHILLERIAPGDAAAATLLRLSDERVPALWRTDGKRAEVVPAGDAPAFALEGEAPVVLSRRFDPARRLIVSGWDPTSLAIARLAGDAQIETFLARPDGPRAPPPLPGVTYLRMTPAEAIRTLSVDRWTAFVGATHDSDLDLPACAAALDGGAGYVGLVGAASRAADRRETVAALMGDPAGADRLRAPAGRPAMGKAPWRIAIGIVADVIETLGDSETGG